MLGRRRVLPLAAFALGLVVVFYAGPVAYLVVESFRDNSELVSSGRFVGLANLRSALADGDLRQSLAASLLFTLPTVALEVVGATAAALLTRRPGRTTQVARALLVLPYFLPSIVIVVAWRFVSDPFVGPLPALLRLAGLPPLDFRGPVAAVPLMWLVATYEAFPFGYIIILARLLQVPGALYEQAEVAGATPVQAFRIVTWPHLRGTIVGVAAVRALLTWMKFDTPWLIYAGQAPAPWTDTLPVVLYRLAFERLQRGSAYAASLIVLLILGTVAFGVFGLRARRVAS